MIKFKKNSLVLALSLMGIGVYPVISANIAFAQTNSSQVVFLSNGTGGGAGTQESPYTDLKTALAQAKAKNAVLKLAGNVTYQGNTSTGTNIIPLDLGGVTIDGQGHTLTVRFSPLSLNGDVVMQNLKLELVNDEGILAREQTNYIYMNGYNLTLDNVDTKIGSHENMFATVVMGAGENVSTTPNNNRLTLTGSTTKLKEVIAGNANNTERTSDSVISIGKDVTVGTVRFSGKGSNVSGAVNVSSQSQHVSQYNGSNSGKDSLTLDLGPTFKSTAITDINELTILGSTNVSISDLSANTIKFAEGSNAVLNIQDSDATVKTVSGTGTVRINNGNKLTVTDPLSADLKVDIGGGFNQDINNYVVVPEGSKQFIKDINNSATASNKYQGQPVVTLEKDNNVVSAKITLPTGTEVGDNVFVTVGDADEFLSVTAEDLKNGYIKVQLPTVGEQEQDIQISEVQIADGKGGSSVVFEKDITLSVTPATDNPQTQPPTDTDSTQTDSDSSQSGNGTPEEPPANPDQGESTETEGNPPTDSQNNDGENGETNSDQTGGQNTGGTQEGSTENTGTQHTEQPSETDNGVGDNTEQPPTTGTTTEGTTNGDQTGGQNTGGTQEGSTENTGTQHTEQPSETDNGVGDNTEQPPTTDTTTEGTTNGDQTGGQNTGGTQEGSTENTGTQPTEQPSETDNGVGDSTEQPPTTGTTTEGTTNGDQSDGQNTGGTQEGSTENTGTQPTEQPSETDNGVGDNTEQPPTTGSTTEGTTNGDQSDGQNTGGTQEGSTENTGTQPTEQPSETDNGVGDNTEQPPTTDTTTEGTANGDQTNGANSVDSQGNLTTVAGTIKDVVVANAHSQVQTVLSLGQDLVASMTLPLPAQKHLNVWVKENVTKIKSYSTQDYQAYRTNSNLTQLGVSSLLNDNVWAGVILNDVRNNNHFANSVNGKNHLQMISVFTRIQHQNGLFVIADIGTGRIKNQWATEQESIKFKRSFNQAGLTVGAGLALDKLVITPKAGLRYSRLNSLSYNFDGVKVDEKALNVMSYFAGADIGYKIMIEPSVSVKPYVSAEYWRSKNRFNLQAQNEVLHFNVGNQYHLSAGVDVSYKNVSFKISGGKANGKDSSKQTTMKFALSYQW